MWLVRFYRFYLSLGAGTLVYLGLIRAWWALPAGAIGFRVLWSIAERLWVRRRTEELFRIHSARFKQEFGPYGIRLINKAASDARVRRRLAEVFTPNLEALRRTVEQLEVMDTLFNAGMRPGGDEYLLHDCMLKYARLRTAESAVRENTAEGTVASR